MPQRLAAPLIRFAFAQFRAGSLSARAGARRLRLGRTRFSELYADYLRACAANQSEGWSPGVSGGDHAPAWPEDALALLRKRLSSRPPSNYSFPASEVLRLGDFKRDRAQGRRWALENHLAHPQPAPIRRWQRAQPGELWQPDVLPPRWFPSRKELFPMFNMLDDCSRLFVGSQLYERESLLACLDFLPAAVIEYGRPLALDVDYPSFCFTHVPEALTPLGEARHFYGGSFRYAPPAQAKGPIEREHLFWQNRRPAYFAAETIADLAEANPHIRDLRLPRNQHESTANSK